MREIRFFGTPVEYDPTLQYLSIGVVGSGHGGEVRGKYSNPYWRLALAGKRVHDFQGLVGVALEVETELGNITCLLHDGTRQVDALAVKLAESERQSYRNTGGLYIRALETFATLFDQSQEHKRHARGCREAVELAKDAVAK